MMKLKTDIIDALIEDGKVWEYKKKYQEKYGKNAPPYCIWGPETIEEYKEKLRKAVEE